MDSIVGTSTTSWNEVDELISTLRAWGIGYLVGLEHPADSSDIKMDQQSAIVLIQRLARCHDYPRVRDACIALFLLHPELVGALQNALRESDPEVVEQIAVLTLATLYLQQLGQTFHKAARLYLVGGAALVHSGVRQGFTQAIDVQVTGTGEGDLIVAIQRLVEHLQVNVEFASPVDFMPLPSQWETRSRFIGRYGRVDVFYFDFYSIALSKRERGNDRDIADVKLLVQEGIIALAELDKAYEEVLAQLGKGRYPRVTPKRFAQRYQAIRLLP